jgi:hypothetical protein
VSKYWASQTLQSHHILEDSLVRDLGARFGQLTRGEAPCILLFADFHQGYFRFYNRRESDDEDTVKLKHTLQQEVEHFAGLSKATDAQLQTVLNRTKEVLPRVYKGMEPLIPIAEAEVDLIPQLREANLKQKKEK